MRINSDTNMKRRDFLNSAAIGALFSCSLGSATETSNSDKVTRLACNSWPFRGYFDTPQMHQYRNSQYPLLTQADFPQFLADHFNIHNVEFLPQHFADTVHDHANDLVVDIDDDGVGGADPARGSGLRGLADRVHALDGRLALESPPGNGTHLHAEIPCGS